MNVSVLTVEVTLCPMSFEHGSCKDTADDRGVHPATIAVFKWQYTIISVGTAWNKIMQ
jgi:hypothetical protein